VTNSIKLLASVWLFNKKSTLTYGFRLSTMTTLHLREMLRMLIITELKYTALLVTAERAVTLLIFTRLHDVIFKDRIFISAFVGT